MTESEGPSCSTPPTGSGEFPAGEEVVEGEAHRLDRGERHGVAL